MTKEKEQVGAELQARIKGFNEELMPLLGKYKLGLSAQPVFIPSKDASLGYIVAAKPVIFEDSKEESQTKVEGAEPPGEKVEGEIAKSE